MEEVDSIILHFLRQLNINIPDEAKSICDLPVEIIIESASRCLRETSNTLKLPSKFPSGISHRIEVASQIASICKDLGYKNEVGYQTFLYYNEAELRQVFMFLIESLPTEGKQTNNTTSTNKKSVFMQEISNKINEELNSIWIPPSCTPSQKCIGDFKKTGVEQNNVQKLLNQDKIIEKLLRNIAYPPLNTEPVKIKTSLPKDSLNHCTMATNCDISKSLKELKEEAIVLRQRLDTLESAKNVMDVEYSQAKKACDKIQAEIQNVKEILKSIGITEVENEVVDNILQNVESNLCILHRKSDELTSKNISLKMDIDKIKNSSLILKTKQSVCKKILTTLKEEAKSMKEEFEKNEEVKNQLKKAYEKLKGGNKRVIYTKRILEIISNVDKQNIEIKKILEDTRQLQKEINSLEGQLDRCFSIADETLFRDAKKDDQAKKAYKLLALLHSECSTIVSLVNDTGTIARDIVDLEDNIKTEQAKKTEDTLKKIHIDLTKMQQESLVGQN